MLGKSKQQCDNDWLDLYCCLIINLLCFASITLGLMTNSYKNISHYQWEINTNPNENSWLKLKLILKKLQYNWRLFRSVIPSWIVARNVFSDEFYGFLLYLLYKYLYFIKSDLLSLFQISCLLIARWFRAFTTLFLAHWCSINFPIHYWHATSSMEQRSISLRSKMTSQQSHPRASASIYVTKFGTWFEVASIAVWPCLITRRTFLWPFWTTWLKNQ